MIETLLTTTQVAEQPPDLPGVFLFDHETRTDLINNNASVTVSGATVDTTYLIDGFPTTKLPSITSYMLITIPTPLELDANDWTLEWSRMGSAYQATRYDGEIRCSTTASKWLVSRWTDAGYGSQLQNIAGVGTNEADFWRIPGTKQSTVGILQRMALVCRQGVIFVFKDGVPQKVTNWNIVGGAANQVTRNSFNKEAGMGKLNTIRLGWLSTVAPAAISNIGRIRFSDYARYIHPYTPVPF
jgi:hypothetical protein